MNKDEVILVLALVREDFEKEKRDAQEMYEIFGHLDDSYNGRNVSKAITRTKWSYPASFALPKNVGHVWL